MSTDNIVSRLRSYETGDAELINLLGAAADEIERLERERAEWAGVAGTRTAEVQLAEADAIRYRWLKFHIAPTIINRIDKSLYSWPPARLDEIIDARLKPVDVTGSTDTRRASHE